MKITSTLTTVTLALLGINHTVNAQQHIATGVAVSMAICNDSTVKTWGDNGNGGLGNGTTTNTLTHVQVSGLTGIIAVSSEGNHSLALKSNGTVWGWGYNRDGELGNGTTDNGGCYCKTTAVQATGLTNVIKLATGSAHSLALKNDGTVWAWGDNTYGGQLGDGTMVSKLTPIQVTALSGIVDIIGGDFFSLALKNDGTLWAWGSNMYGQIGNASANQTTPVQIMTNVMGIGAGQNHSMALKTDSTVWTWGYNANGQLGNGSPITSSPNSTPAQVTGLTGVRYIRGGFNHGVAVKSDGTMWVWGGNYSGQLGNNTTTQSNTPIQVMGIGTLAVGTEIVAKNINMILKPNGDVWSWGSNFFGELGDGTHVDKKVPVQQIGFCTVASSVNEVAEQLAISVYPNPSNGKFSVNMDNEGELTGNDKIEIYNMYGAKVSEQATNEVDLSNAAKGVYYVKIYHGTETGTKKVIVQ